MRFVVEYKPKSVPDRSVIATYVDDLKPASSGTVRVRMKSHGFAGADSTIAPDHEAMSRRFSLRGGRQQELERDLQHQIETVLGVSVTVRAHEI